MADYEILKQKITELVSMLKDIPEDWDESPWHERHIAFRYCPDRDTINISFVTETYYSEEGPIMPAMEEKHQDETGYIYILRVDNGYCKVGRTKYLDDRMFQLGVTLPYDPELVCAVKVDDYMKVERELHKLFSDAGKHKKGEWFELSEDDIEYITGLGAQDG